MPSLLKQDLTEQDVLFLIEKSIEESIANASVKPSDMQVSYIKDVAASLVKPFFDLTHYHIQNDGKVDEGIYTQFFVDKFYVFLSSAKEALQKTRQERLAWLIITFAILAPFRQFQRDAEQLQQEDLIFALNRLELDLLKMMNESRKML
ncbi:hypothetical protein [Ferruginibacter sp.]